MPVLGRDLDPEVPLARYLTQSVVVFDRGGEAVDFLGPPGGLLGHGGAVSRFAEFCHPDDVPLLIEVWAECADAPPGWVAGGRLRLHQGDDRWGWYRVELWNQLGVEGIDGMVVVTAPIPPDALSEGTRSVEQLLGQLEPSVAAAAGLTSLTLDGNGVIQWVTPQTQQLVGTGVPLVGQRLVDLMSRSSQPVVLGHLAQLAPGEERTVIAELVTGDDQEIGIELRLIGGVREPLSMVTAVITDRREVPVLLRMATTDPLTGLVNRARILEVLSGAVASGQRCSVIYGDIDGLKACNDRFGHSGGDALVAAVAQHLRSVIGDRGTVGRISGDEFVMVVSGRSEAEVERLAAQASLPVPVAELPTRLGTVSVGVAHHRFGESIDELLGRADQAMYDAKRRRWTQR